MNKIQIKAEILATIRVLSSSAMPEPSLLTDLKNIEDKKTVTSFRPEISFGQDWVVTDMR